MKLVDILARQLKEWPGDKCRWVEYSADNGCIADMGVGYKDAHVDCSLLDHGARGKYVTRAEWQAAVDALKAENAVEWTGEGLPPVGVVCELKSASKFTEGTRLEEFPAGTRMLVGGRANFGGQDVSVVRVDGLHFCGTIIPEMLRPIRTAEQIAAEEREKYLQEVLKLFEPGNPYDYRTIGERMYDAGYRKQPK